MSIEPMLPRVGFVFIGYNQFEELKLTLHNLRYHSPFANVPVSVVLSGDEEKEFHDYGENIITHVPNIVQHSVEDIIKYIKPSLTKKRPGVGFMHYNEPACNWAGECASCSILRNYSVGVNTLYEKFGNNLDYIVVTESNILILNWITIVNMVKKLYRTETVGAFEIVKGYDDSSIPWCGKDIMPQMFIVDWSFCLRTKFLFDSINNRPNAVEVTMKDNIDRCLELDGKNFDEHIINCGDRGQWGIHVKENFIWFAHLDRPTGADGDPNLRWSSREQQLNYEMQVLQHFGQCLGECNGK